MKRIFFTLALCIMGVTLHAQSFDDLAKTPPMGWSSWNCFGTNINEDQIKEIADLMVSTGMRDAGYVYLNLDDGWQVSRDEDGKIVPDEKAFPNGIKALADYIHSKGLKFGLYSCAGSQTCACRPGSRGYQFQDAITYARWGVDYLKYDWCFDEGQSPKAAYKTMSDALKSCGRPIVFSICEWGNSRPWEWAQGVGHLWRTTGDICNSFDGINHWGATGVCGIIDKNAGLAQYAGPGHWNDPDMLQVGNGVLTMDENRAQFSMWSMMAAPLIAGNDLRKMDKETLAILTNKEVIAVDQDTLGRQGIRYMKVGDHETWIKELSGGEGAVCFFNRDEEPWEFELNWAKDIYYGQILPWQQPYKVRDLWLHKDLGSTKDKMKIKVPAHGVVLFLLTPENKSN